MPTPAAASRLAAYQAKAERLIARGLTVQAQDIRRMRRAYEQFRRRALAAFPQRYAMNQATAISVLGSIEGDLARLGAQTTQIVRDAAYYQAELAQQITEIYGENFLPYGTQVPIMGASARAVELVNNYSADLIGLNTGGLSMRVLDKINQEIRLNALAAGGTTFQAAQAIGRALGAAGWIPRAEKIYRTETLRVHSLLMEQSIQDLDAKTPTLKRWIWSGISRLEHKAISGQTVRSSQSFRVPLRRGGSILMRYPRAAGAPAEAVINCGCYHIPVPRDAVSTQEIGPPARPRPAASAFRRGVRPTPARAMAIRAGELHQAAVLAEPATTKMLKGIAEKLGGKMEGLRFRLKDRKGIQGKLARYKRQPWAKRRRVDGLSIDDSLRYTISVGEDNYIAAIREARRQLKRAGWTEIEINNAWADPYDTYNGVHLIAKRGQARFELQFHTPKSYLTKDVKNHLLYEEFRATGTSLKRRQELFDLMADNWRKVPIPKGKIPGRLQIYKRPG